MKKIILVFAVLGTAFALTACDLNNDQMKDVITQCKEDTECKAILDKEIDEALAERGITNDNLSLQDDELLDSDTYYATELSEIDEIMFNTLYDLDEELYEKLDSMTDEELSAIENIQLSEAIGRELSTEEAAAIQLVESLYSNYSMGDGTEIQDFNTEADYLAHYLKRDLTTEETNALTILEQVIETDEDFQFTQEQTNAIDLISALYEESFNNFELEELESMLNRSLTTEEQEAINLVNNLYMDGFETNVDDAQFLQNEINYYELVLDRFLTDQEKDALEFGIDFMNDCAESIE